MVVLANIDQAGTSIVRTDVASATLFLTRHDDNSDSVVVSSAWVVPIQQGQTGSGLRQYAVAYAGHSATVSRVDFVDLTTNPPVLVHTEFQQDSSYSGVRPTTIQLAGGGRRVVLRCSAAPHEDFSTNPSINPATGEDVWYFSLDDPIQSLFQYEISGVPQAASDPLAVSRFRAVNVSNHFFGNDGYVHTIEIQ
jgi:hypothetical protein